MEDENLGEEMDSVQNFSLIPQVDRIEYLQPTERDQALYQILQVMPYHH